MQGNEVLDTSAYWRKLLKIDADSNKNAIKKFDSNLKIFRSFFHKIISSFLNYCCQPKNFGIQNLPDPPFILASNHLSVLDFPLIFFGLPNHLRKKIVAIYKFKYHKNLFTRFFIKIFCPSIPVNMKEKPWEALSMAVDVLKSGGIVYIAPEGTRNKNKEILPYKPGVGAIAVETKIPVIPIHIKNSEKILPRGSILPKKHNVEIFWGIPIKFEDLFEKKKVSPAYEVYKEAAESIKNSIKNLEGIYK